jgi:DNA-binding NtrC family response regulator
MLNLAKLLAAYEKQLILCAIRLTDSREEAAKMLGITRKCLWQKMKRYEIPTRNYV